MLVSPTFIVWIIVLTVIIVLMTWKRFRQKTQSPQRRRMFAGTAHARQSSSLSDPPPIYVSPVHLPAPPKYEFTAPPSYEEVVGVHYPIYQTTQLPIRQPLSLAIQQDSANPPPYPGENSNSTTTATIINEVTNTSTGENTNTEIRTPTNVTQ